MMVKGETGRHLFTGCAGSAGPPGPREVQAAFGAIWDAGSKNNWGWPIAGRV